MASFSEQFSLREIVGNLAPGAIVLSSVFYVFSKTTYYKELTSSAPDANSILNNPFIILAIAFITSYGIGMLLTSLTQTIFNAVTKLGAGARGPTVDTNQKPESNLRQAYGSGAKLLKRLITHLSGGQDITSTIRDFRASWQEQAVKEGVISEKAFNLAADHYRTLLNSEPAGEESLFYCELLVRDRLPTAAQEIEQNAAKAALMGNLIVPILCWLIAIGIGLTIAISKDYSKPDQKSPELQKLALDVEQAKENLKDQQEQQRQYEEQLRQYQEQLRQYQERRRSPSLTFPSLTFEERPTSQGINSPKNTELDLKHQLQQLELKHKQQEQQEQKKQKSGMTVLAELFIFVILLTIFPYIVRMISRLWIEASRNYVRIVILSFSLACFKPSTGQNKPPETSGAAS
ncbi:MAG TPA: hypothetical protein VI479_12875 [Blastocatellia bacterium]